MAMFEMSEAQVAEYREQVRALAQEKVNEPKGGASRRATRSPFGSAPGCGQAPSQGPA